jgi:hypothetical protein
MLALGREGKGLKAAEPADYICDDWLVVITEGLKAAALGDCISETSS